VPAIKVVNVPPSPKFPRKNSAPKPIGAKEFVGINEMEPNGFFSSSSAHIVPVPKIKRIIVTYKMIRFMFFPSFGNKEFSNDRQIYLLINYILIRITILV
jgi:hypothetical protein